MGRSHRPQMLGEEIRKLISEMLARGELKDPAFSSLLGISGVDVTRDGSYATVYVTALSFDPKEKMTDEGRKEILGAFERAKGYIRTTISKNIKLRYTPELIFKFDTSFDYGEKMDRLFAELHKDDK